LCVFSFKLYPCQNALVETGFREHLGGAAAAGLAFAYFLNSSLGYSLESIIPPFLLFTVSGILPDIDSPRSKPRKFFRLAVLAGLVLIAYAYYPALAGIHFTAPFLFPVIGFLGIEAAIPGHRGVMHSSTAAILWGAALFLLLRNPLAGLAAAFGYATHLLIDYVGDRT